MGVSCFVVVLIDYKPDVDPCREAAGDAEEKAGVGPKERAGEGGVDRRTLSDRLQDW